MQNIFKSTKTFLSTLFVFSALLSIARLLILLFGFDFESLFFTSNKLSTALYIVFLIFALFYYLTAPKTEKAFKSEESVFLDLVFAITFLLISVALMTEKSNVLGLQKIAQTISTVFAFLSTIYYFLKAFFKEKISPNLFGIFNVVPVIFFLSQILYNFVYVSSRANTYHLFADMFAMIILSLFLLREKKSEVGDMKVALLPIASVTLLSLSFSVVPNVILTILGRFHMSNLDILILIFEIITLFTLLRKLLKMAK